jgi:transcription initiation factor IIE alpha subunit
MKEILIRKSDPLNGACRSYFEILKSWLIKEKKTVPNGRQATFNNREIRQALRIKGTTLRRYHSQLLDAGLLLYKSGKKATGYHYELISTKEYEELKGSISNVLDDVLSKCSGSSA